MKPLPIGACNIRRVTPLARNTLSTPTLLHLAGNSALGIVKRSENGIEFLQMISSSLVEVRNPLP